MRDGSSRHIKASQKTASHSISERSNSDENSSTADPDEKRSNTPSKQLSEINNVLHKSVVNYLVINTCSVSLAMKFSTYRCCRNDGIVYLPRPESHQYFRELNMRPTSCTAL